MIAATVELGELHSDRITAAPRETERIDGRRAHLVHEIDRFVVLAVPVPFPSARIHTETIGRVIDRIAELTAMTYVVLTAPSDTAYVDACAQLDELASAYQDLVDDLAAGTRRLPDHGL
ncbi:DUF4254 domain-containing protein [Nocardia cyriacigeorgica]|uniref:DUF4254 domain-containing protein n=1 Tax=Nocardia cyriacigeorgica TaxID=135487 RepID=UPI0018961455|nr:DUF4254 domain-containing protein [Nocardia cyriacigeorgica]MBF6100168.1 DUF4254 domain-containing protein [Nocardia cyriacigeorgica]MBF6202060.1 DUF4254 domain-containing protein [Nocardia cyriacigeorgica]MBF6318443.1 DUF4254 domain-containing protein [Nocardia cyriacigeorgica]MBF6517478.1 DUF4254 domain-containing protein [Nocardia cyriacigeorgica]MBF6533889.1 DUF4254 domain-containing protein [Nocardia cyriacigeorgica]